LVAVSKKLWQLISPERIARHRYSRNGALFVTLPSSTRKEKPGIAWFISVHLLQRFAQDDRVKIRRPEQDLQVKMVRSLSGDNEFVAYIDALGELDGTQCLIDWKTTTSRYSEEPAGLLSLDPQMICYSWISGIQDVAVVVFVRKSVPEIQYLKASITDEQQSEYGHLAEATVGQIQSGQFPPHSGIRFPQNGCVSCSHLGLCLDRPELVAANLIRKPGASDLDWLDELVD
jgi:hypothetical protein